MLYVLPDGLPALALCYWYEEILAHREQFSYTFHRDSSSIFSSVSSVACPQGFEQSPILFHQSALTGDPLISTPCYLRIRPAKIGSRHAHTRSERIKECASGFPGPKASPPASLAQPSLLISRSRLPQTFLSTVSIHFTNSGLCFTPSWLAMAYTREHPKPRSLTY